MKLKLIIDRMLCMSENAWFWFIRSLQLSCAAAFCAWMMLLPDNIAYDTYRTAIEIAEQPKAILLIGLLLSVITEDMELKNKL